MKKISWNKLKKKACECLPQFKGRKVHCLGHGAGCLCTEMIEKFKQKNHD